MDDQKLHRLSIINFKKTQTKLHVGMLFGYARIVIKVYIN